MTDYQDVNYVAGVDKAVPEARADAYVNTHSYAANCAERAVEEGHRAFAQPDGSFSVVSETNSEDKRTVRYYALGRDPWSIRFSCDCPSGANRLHLLIPCKHAWLAGRNLMNRGMAVADGALFVVSHAFRPAEDRLCILCKGVLGSDQASGSECRTCVDVFGKKGE